MELTLQWEDRNIEQFIYDCYNPCFYGINFAIIVVCCSLLHEGRYNPCFYGINFAISTFSDTNLFKFCYNPCFYGINFAIIIRLYYQSKD